MKYCCFDMDRITIMFGTAKAFSRPIVCVHKKNTEREIHKATVEDNDVIKTNAEAKMDGTYLKT